MTIINRFLDMRWDDATEVDRAMQELKHHPSRRGLFLGALLGTSIHGQRQLYKRTYDYCVAHGPHLLNSYAFGVRDGPYILVNIMEEYDPDADDYVPNPGIPHQNFGIRCNLENIPIPLFFVDEHHDIDGLVRIDITTNRRYIPSPDDWVLNHSLRNRAIERCGIARTTTFTFFDEEEDHMGLFFLVEAFENLILDFLFELNKTIINDDDLLWYVKGVLHKLNPTQPYEDASGTNILRVQLPEDDTVYMISLNCCADVALPDAFVLLESNMKNLLLHYIPDYAFNDMYEDHDVMLLAITYIPLNLGDRNLGSDFAISVCLSD
ncbi:hypothetical protein Bhyg_03536, partial [Pseudolycoriella hygida]